ncbi:MAG: hypothetical protein EOO25_03230 [Comamonadaceae bacterium]|nr:MAG: hypothetical protein EOO25_03230 [Comamonadaceae bacterium]
MPSTSFHRLTLSVLALATLAPPALAAADPSCDKLLQASAFKPGVPYRVSQTMTVDGKAEVHEAVYIDGKLYSQIAGKWRVMPIPDMADASKVARETTRQCVAGGTELLGTTPTRMWTSQVKTQFDDKPVQWKTWVGVADGRLYRQQSQGFDQRIFYDNVVAPAVAPATEKKKR